MRVARMGRGFARMGRRASSITHCLPNAEDFWVSLENTARDADAHAELRSQGAGFWGGQVPAVWSQYFRPLAGKITSGFFIDVGAGVPCPTTPLLFFLAPSLPPSLPPGATIPARAHTHQPASIGFPPFLSERRRKPPPAFQHARCSCTREHRASASSASHNSALVSPDLHPPRPPSLLTPLSSGFSGTSISARTHMHNFVSPLALIGTN